MTGAASGIGHGIAKRFAQAGGRVVIADIELEAAEKAAREIGGPDKALAVEMDVTNEDAVNRGVEKTVSAFGTVDILVSNAGVQIVYPVEAFPFADWKKMLAIHLDGAFLTSKACLPHMYKQKSGSIIFMGSVHSKEASPLKSAYVTAKHGLLGLARVIAKEGAAHGVRTNVICPGFVKTPLVEKQIPEQAKNWASPKRRSSRRSCWAGQWTRSSPPSEDVARLRSSSRPSRTNALTGQSLVVSHAAGRQIRLLRSCSRLSTVKSGVNSSQA